MELVPAVDIACTNNLIQVSFCGDSSVVNTEFGGESHSVAVNREVNGDEATQQHHGRSYFPSCIFSTEYIVCSSPVHVQLFERIRHSTDNSDEADSEESCCTKTLSILYTFYMMMFCRAAKE